MLGGDRPRVASATAEQEEVDLYVAARLLWDVRELLHNLPDLIAQKVWSRSPFNNSG